MKMKLINLYVAEVGRRLPLRGRKDIETELRSTLEDMLEDLSRKSGRPVGDALANELLKEYGPPDKVAAAYHPTQYLIGPRLYPFFLLVLRILFSALTVVLLAALGIELATQPLAGGAPAEAIGRSLLGILNGALQAFGNIVLVFAILERVLPASEFKFEDRKRWDPASLMKLAEPTQVKLWEPILAIVFTVAAIVIFNGYPQLIGLSFLRNGVWTSVPALSEAFFRWLPYINVLWVLKIALNLVLLRQGRWQTFTKWFSIVLDVAGIVLGYFLLAGPSIVNLSTETLQATGVFGADTAAVLSQVAQQAGRIVIAIVMIVQGAEVVKHLVRQILRRP